MTGTQLEHITGIPLERHWNATGTYHRNMTGTPLGTSGLEHSWNPSIPHLFQSCSHIMTGTYHWNATGTYPGEIPPAQIFQSHHYWNATGTQLEHNWNATGMQLEHVWD
jgi:hypothetical protein